MYSSRGRGPIPIALRSTIAAMCSGVGLSGQDRRHAVARSCASRVDIRLQAVEMIDLHALRDRTVNRGPPPAASLQGLSLGFAFFAAISVSLACSAFSNMPLGGIKPGGISASGPGESEPVAPNMPRFRPDTSSHQRTLANVKWPVSAGFWGVCGRW